MKLIQEKTKDSAKSVIEIENGETVLRSEVFYGAEKIKFGELIIPEGIEEIVPNAFSDCFFSVLYFPKSLKALGRKLFRMASDIKIIYAGNSKDFMQIAAVKEESVCESDGFDRYPYYSGGARWVTYYRSFDEQTGAIEVVCQEDGVTLLYGTKYRHDGELPKIKEN